MLRAALLGCGWIGSELRSEALGIATHAAAYSTCPDTELVAVADLDEAKANQSGERWDVAARYIDTQRLFAEAGPEIVSICTPDATHYDFIKQAIAAPSVRAILAEKPLAANSVQARELAELARDRGVLLAVNYSRRHSPTHREVRERLLRGELGRIVTVGGIYSKGVRHNGTHWFDLARWFFGEVAGVSGFDFLGETGGDPTLDAVIRFASGTSTQLRAFDAAAGAVFEMDIAGTAGRVRITDGGATIESSRMKESPTFPGFRVYERDSSSTAPDRDLLLHAVQDLVTCLTQGGQPRCAAEDGIAALEIAEAVLSSARSGQSVSL